MRQTITFNHPLIDHSEKVAYVSIEKTKVDHNGVILDTSDIIFKKEHSYFLVIENPGEESTLTIKAGDVFPNSVLGDYIIELKPGTSVINIKDVKRFEMVCKEFVIDFSENFSGEMYAIADFHLE